MLLELTSVSPHRQQAPCKKRPCPLFIPAAPSSAQSPGIGGAGQACWMHLWLILFKWNLEADPQRGINEHVCSSLMTVLEDDSARPPPCLSFYGTTGVPTCPSIWTLSGNCPPTCLLPHGTGRSLRAERGSDSSLYQQLRTQASHVASRGFADL